MKKSSLMGASVVAAALLAAAPVVAPVASLATPGTQVVKADVDYTSQAASKITSMSTDTNITAGDNYGHLNDFNNQLNSLTDLLSYRQNLHQFTENPTTSDAFKLTTQGSNFILQTNDKMIHANTENQQVAWLLKYFFSGSNQVNLGSQENYNAASKMSYTLQFKYSNAINNVNYDIISAADVGHVQRDLSDNGGTVTMLMQLYDGANKPIENNGLLKSTVSYNVNNARAAYVNYADTLSAHVGDSAQTFGLSNSFMNANGQIRDYNGNDITMAAYNRGAISVTPLGAKNQHPTNVDNGIVNGNFTRSGQYYQKVVIDLRQVLGSQVDGWTEADWRDAVNGGLITVNGQIPNINNSDANVFLVTHVDNNTSNQTVVDGTPYPGGTLILKRTVNVDVDQGAFKTDKINGKVTVNMNDGMAAQVYDENGKQVLGRALPNKSAWKTIEKRTYYKDGQVFYQVSTNEYVKAQDVVFTEYSSSSNSNSNDQLSGKVNVTKYPSKVINILNDSHAAGVYAINEDGQGMHQVIGRFLPAGSAWINQGTAEVNGNLFYQVSTNEWVSANSVAK